METFPSGNKKDKTKLISHIDPMFKQRNSLHQIIEPANQQWR